MRAGRRCTPTPPPPPKVAKWKRQLLFCQRRAEVATGQWPRSCRWHNNHYMPEEVEFLPSPPSSPMRPVEEDNPPTSREELPPPHLSPVQRRGLLGPPPPPVSPLTNTLRAIEQSIAQQTARIEARTGWGSAPAPATASTSDQAGPPPGWGAAFCKP